MHTSATLEMAGIALNSALITTFIPADRDAMRNGRSARNARRIFAATAAFSSDEDASAVIAADATPSETMQKSRTFQPFLKYRFPSATIFKAASNTKRPTKNTSETSSQYFKRESLSTSTGESTANRHDDNTIMNSIDFSNHLCVTNDSRLLRIALSRNRRVAALARRSSPPTFAASFSSSRSFSVFFRASRRRSFSSCCFSACFSSTSAACLASWSPSPPPVSRPEKLSRRIARNRFNTT